MRARDLRQLLTTTPDVYGVLREALVRPTTGTSGPRVSGGGGDERPAPLQLQVAEHRHTGLRGLRWWVHTLDTRLARAPHTLGPTPRVGESPAAMCAWLMHGAYLLDHDQAAELADNLATWQHRARVLTDLPQLRGRLPLGAPCAASTEHWRCPGELWAMLPADRDRPMWLACPECRARWTPTELPAALDVVVPVRVAAELLGVTVRTVQRRASRDGGRVRLGDVLDQDTD